MRTTRGSFQASVVETVQAAIPSPKVLEHTVRPLSLVEPGVSAVSNQLTALQAASLQKALERISAQQTELLQAQQT